MDLHPISRRLVDEVKDSGSRRRRSRPLLTEEDTITLFWGSVPYSNLFVLPLLSPSSPDTTCTPPVRHRDRVGPAESGTPLKPLMRPESEVRAQVVLRDCHGTP